MIRFEIVELDDEGRRLRSHSFEAPSHQDALRQAWAFIDQYDLELWAGEKLVAKLFKPAGI